MADGRRGMRKMSGLRLVAALLVLLVLCGTARADNARHVLVLHSYHSGMSWVANIEDAIRKTLMVPPFDDLILHIEYMDTKRYHSEAYYSKLHKVLKEKYQGLKLSLILSSDNNAFDFLVKYRDEIFPGAPVVFCGVNNFSDDWLDGVSGFTGVAEIMSSRDTVAAILEQLPDTKDIYVVNDYLKTGRAWRATISRNLKPFEGKVRISYNDNLSIDELRAKIQSMKPGSVVLLGVYFSDRDGRYLTYEKLGTMLTSDSPVPVYCLLRFNLRDGVIGGKLISGYHQGLMMSEVARRVLSGVRPEDIPVVKVGANAFIFDWQGMNRHGIPMSKLPQESVVFNEPFSFYDEYYYLVWATIAVFGILVMFLLVLLRNIATLKAVRKDLSYSERMYRSIFDNANEGIFQTSFDGKLLAANMACASMFGYPSPEELLRSVKNVGEDIYADAEDRKVVLEGVKRDGKITGVEVRVKRRDGVVLWMNLNVRLSETPDGAAILEGSMADITERKQAQAELNRFRKYLSNIIDSMPSMLVGVDRDGQVILWNRTAEKVTGISAESAQGQQLVEVLPQMEVVVGELEESIRLKTPTRQQKVPRREESETRYEDITIYPLITGAVEGAVVRIDDVTSRVNLEKMMVQSEKMMSVGGLAAGMAHEINNPLAAVIGYVYNIRKRIFGDIKKNAVVAEEVGLSLEAMRSYMLKREVDSMLDGVAESGERAAKIISNMLNFSRKSEVKADLYAIPDLLDKTVELAANVYDMQKQYDFRRIEIVREYEAGVPDVQCDGNEIQQVFLNLLKNGAEAMAEKEFVDEQPRFILRVRKEEDMVSIEVEDNGPGMDEVVRRRILEPFYTTKPVGKGTGLGLSVAYFIVADLHKGGMEVSSQRGEWTRIKVKLPISDSNVSE